MDVISSEARCFVGIRLGDEAMRSLATVIDRLRGHRAPVRWARPENVHVTLKFLGDVPRERFLELAEALESTRRQPLSLGVSGLGRFPTEGPPRVLWAGLIGDVDGLRALHGEIETRLEALGYPRENRPYRPHVTIGRVRDGHGLGPLLSDMTHVILRVAPTPVDAFRLYESQLGEQGPRYVELGKYTL